MTRRSNSTRRNLRTQLEKKDDAETTPRDEQPSVKLGKFGDPAIVLGKVKSRILSFAQYRVVKALLEAGEIGLSKDELDRTSGHRDARKILARLARSDPDWRAVIRMAVYPGCHYRIIDLRKAPAA